MRIDVGLDTGDTLLKKEVEIQDDDTSETLGARLSQVGADLMVETLRRLGTSQPASTTPGSLAGNASTRLEKGVAESIGITRRWKLGIAFAGCGPGRGRTPDFVTKTSTFGRQPARSRRRHCRLIRGLWWLTARTPV